MRWHRANEVPKPSPENTDMSQDSTHQEPESESEAEERLSSRDLLADLESRLTHAEKRYNEEQQDGDAISIASTRGTFLAIRDARALVRKHFPANAHV